MNSSVRIICPACYSAHIEMYLRGLNSSAAGAMTMPAGNVKDNNMEFKCKDCGKTFEPSEGKMQQESVTGTGAYKAEDTGIVMPDNNKILQDKHIVELLKQQGKLQAIKYLKDTTGMGLKEAKDYVDGLSTTGNFTTKKEGCFIATACYGHYAATEVMVLRKFRDQQLAPFGLGRLLIRFYYRVSPALARQIAGSHRGRYYIRTYLLSP